MASKEMGIQETKNVENYINFRYSNLRGNDFCVVWKQLSIIATDKAINLGMDT